MTQANNNCKRVLVFNSLKRLINIGQSAFALAKANNWNLSSVRSACLGTTITYNNLYFRYLDDNIEVTADDLGVLELVKYDELCGVTRKMYPDKKMSRKGTKYNKRPKEKSPFYPFKNPQS